MEGWVPDSRRYVPGFGAVQVKLVVAPGATSVEKDWTRGPCGGGVLAPSPGSLLDAGHVSVCTACVGLAVLVAPVPSPPPTWPTIVSDVGIPDIAPGGVGRLFVKLIVRLFPVGTLITTGDQLLPAAGFKAVHELSGQL